MKRKPADRPDAMYLTIGRCPVHRQFWDISLDTLRVEGGEWLGGGHRLTPSKCCGQWETVRQWKVDPAELLEQVVTEIQSFRAEELERTV